MFCRLRFQFLSVGISKDIGQGCLMCIYALFSGVGAVRVGFLPSLHLPLKRVGVGECCFALCDTAFFGGGLSLCSAVGDSGSSYLSVEVSLQSDML